MNQDDMSVTVNALHLTLLKTVPKDVKKEVEKVCMEVLAPVLPGMKLEWGKLCGRTDRDEDSAEILSIRTTTKPYSDYGMYFHDKNIIRCTGNGKPFPLTASSVEGFKTGVREDSCGIY